jgi:hypothetical protein
MSDMTSEYLCLVLAADVDDYVAWCRSTGRTPLGGTFFAITAYAGIVVTHRRTFLVTDRWRERSSNRRIVQQLQDPKASGGTVSYGDENGPWSSEQVPDLTWPGWWRRHLARAA